MTLDELKSGQKARITSISDGLGASRHLEALGMHPGDCVRMIRAAAFRGPVFLEASGVKLAIGRGMARKVVVDALSEEGRK